MRGELMPWNKKGYNLALSPKSHSVQLNNLYILRALDFRVESNKNRISVSWYQTNELEAFDYLRMNICIGINRLMFEKSTSLYFCTYSKMLYNVYTI